jgi:hypothetical protein
MTEEETDKLSAKQWLVTAPARRPDTGRCWAGGVPPGRDTRAGLLGFVSVGGLAWSSSPGRSPDRGPP